MKRTEAIKRRNATIQDTANLLHRVVYGFNHSHSVDWFDGDRAIEEATRLKRDAQAMITTLKAARRKEAKADAENDHI